MLNLHDRVTVSASDGERDGEVRDINGSLIYVALDRGDCIWFNSYEIVRVL